MYFFSFKSISLFAFDLFHLNIRFDFLPIFKFWWNIAGLKNTADLRSHTSYLPNAEVTQNPKEIKNHF